MVMGMGMRSIWIALRASNYTDRAFRLAIGNLDELEKKEKAHVRMLINQKREAQANVAAGMLYVAMAGMMAGSLANLMMQTQVGAAYMEEFSGVIQELKVAFADTFFETLRPVLDVIMTFLNLMKEHEWIRLVVLGVALLAIGYLALGGAYKLVKGIRDGYIAQQKIIAFLTKKGIMENAAHTVSIHGVTMAYWQLAIATAAAGGAFVVAFMLLKDMHPVITALVAVVFALAAAYWALYIAKSAASMGIAMVFGGIAAGAAAATAASYQNMQFGSRGLPRTGLFFGHKGEVVYNPQTERPTQVANDLRGGRGGTVNHIILDFSGATINTKADKEELLPWIKRAIRDSIRGKE